MVDFLVIGAQKSGTSWFYENIGRNPDVWLPFVKEVHFFDKRFVNQEALSAARRNKWFFENLHFVKSARNRMRKLGNGEIESLSGREAEIAYLQRLVERDFFMTDEWYDFLFSPAPQGKKTGEITPLYCAIGEAGILHIKTRFPAAKLIYLIRDPVERALSCLTMVGRRMGTAMHDPMQILKLARRCLKSRNFHARGDYRSHIPVWDRHFGDQMLYIPFGEIKSEPEVLFQRVESFIGIRQFARYPFLKQVVHATSKSDRIPDEIHALFKELYRAQYVFLKSRFSPEFVDKLY